MNLDRHHSERYILGKNPSNRGFLMKRTVRQNKIAEQLFRGAKFFRIIPALILSMILSISIVACGGGSDYTVSTGSSSSASSAAGETTSDSNDSTDSAQVAAAPADSIRETTTGSNEFFVPAGEFENTEIEVEAGDLVRFKFQAIGRSQGEGDSSEFGAKGTGGAASEGSGANLGAGETEGEITLVVLDSLGETIYAGEPVQADTVEIDIEFSGVHIISFVNTHIYKANLVLVDWTINPTS